MDRLLNFLTVLGVALLFIVLRALRREHIRVEHSVSWLFAAVSLIVLSRSLWLREWFAATLHIPQDPVALLFLLMIVFLGVFYRFSRIVSGLKDMNITLTQRVAILEYHLNRRHEEQQAKS